MEIGKYFCISNYINEWKVQLTDIVYSILCNLLVCFWGLWKRKASPDDLEELMIISLFLSPFWRCNLSSTWITAIAHLILSLLSVCWRSTQEEIRMKITVRQIQLPEDHIYHVTFCLRLLNVQVCSVRSSLNSKTWCQCQSGKQNHHVYYMIRHSL